MLPINQNRFDKLDNESSYWIGFLAADGWITNGPNNRHQTGLNLQLCDKCHIDKFKKFMGSGHKIGIHKNAAQIRFSNEKIFNDLKKWGLCECKTYTEDSLMRKIPIEFRKSFICGLFDGDGSVFTYKQNDKEYVRVHMCGNKKTMEDVVDYLNNFHSFGRIGMTKNASVWRLAFSSKANVLKFYKLYKNSPIHLERKIEKFNKSINIMENKKGRKNKKDKIQWKRNK